MWRKQWEVTQAVTSGCRELKKFKSLEHKHVKQPVGKNGL